MLARWVSELIQSATVVAGDTAALPIARFSPLMPLLLGAGQAVDQEVPSGLV